jgi:hypothetical protein
MLFGSLIRSQAGYANTTSNDSIATKVTVVGGSCLTIAMVGNAYVRLSARESARHMADIIMLDCRVKQISSLGLMRTCWRQTRSTRPIIFSWTAWIATIFMANSAMCVVFPFYWLFARVCASKTLSAVVDVA